MKLQVAIHAFYLALISINVFFFEATPAEYFRLAGLAAVGFGYGWTVRMLMGEGK